MGVKTVAVLWLLLLGLANGVEVKMKGEWVPEMGWEIKCDWYLSRQLQSVRLYLDDLQFAIYRPERQGSVFHSTYTPPPGGANLNLHCEDQGSNYSGSCSIRVQLLSPPKFDTRYTCEVSEEAPRFDMQQAEYLLQVYVPQTVPQLEIIKANNTKMVNCTSAGIPAPRLRWQIGDHRIQETFSSRTWDFKSKLWHSWSVVSVLQPSEQPLMCYSTATRGSTVVEELVTEVDINSGCLCRGELLLLGLATLVALHR